MLRRRFVHRLLTAVSTAAFWNTGLRSFASSPRQVLSDYPRPSYIPKNFVEVTAISGLQRSVDGFGDGQSEIALWYRNDNHPLGFNNPLAIFITPNPKRAFAGSDDHDPSSMPITFRSGAGGALAQYHDGTRAASRNGDVVWKTNNVHSLVFQFGNYTIGIRGARVVGIDADELTAIASSF
jgi:hypothetical protein